MNVDNLIPEFRSADLGAILNANPLTDLKWRQYFPTEFKTTLTFGNIEGASNARVIAPIVAMDANVVLAGKSTAEIIRGEMPKVEIGRVKTERDFFKLQDLRDAISRNPQNQAVKNQLIANIYDDAIFCREAVNASIEYMAKSLLSRGFYETVLGDKKEIQVKIDFGVKVENSPIDWFDPAQVGKYKPLTLIKEKQREAMANGFIYSKMVMDLATFDQFVASDEVVKFSASFAQNAFGLALTPTLAQVNSALQAQNLPIIEIWNSFMNIENKDGSLVSTSGWELGNIHFTSSQDLGSVQYTISPEASVKLDESDKMLVDDFILISTIGKSKPMRVLTTGMAFATPVLNNTKQRLILKTKLK